MGVNQSIKSNKTGFSLIEIVIYLGILALIMVSFMSFLVSSMKSRNKNYVIREVQAQSRQALTVISNYIKSAESVNTELSVFDTNSSVLVLNMSDSSINPVRISVNGTSLRLQIQEGGNQSEFITTSEVVIDKLLFNYISSSTHDHIRIDLSLSFNQVGMQKDYQYSQDLQTAVSLRQ